jgi:hypothetical protein
MLDSRRPDVPGLNHMTFAATDTAALLVRLNCMLAGIGVILDHENGTRRDLLAATIARPLWSSPTPPSSASPSARSTTLC